ncbi:MAG: hypothetical protein ACLT8E_12190 [Akkermansia sp.]
MLSGELQATLKDKVDYSFWPPCHIPRWSGRTSLRNCLVEAQKYLSAPDVVQKSSFVEVPAIASFNGQALRHVSA